MNARDEAWLLESTRLALDRMLCESTSRISDEQARPVPDAVLLAELERRHEALKRDRRVLRRDDAEAGRAVLEKYSPLVRTCCAPVLRSMP